MALFKAVLARLAYSSLLWLGTPFFLLRLWRRGAREPGYRLHCLQRLGWYGAAHREAVARARLQTRRADAPWVWVHAVSLGETLAARPLLEALRAQWPGLRLLLTHGTATGREAGQALLQAGDVQTWLPYDTPGAVRRFIRAHRPSLGVLMETEVWPNVQHQARCHGLPMVLANARLSEKSLRQGLRFASLLNPAAQAMTLALAQTEDDARRLRQAGVERVLVCGNLKFDLTPAPALLALGQRWAASSARPLVLAAVTREGEETELLQAWRRHLAVWRTPATDDSTLPRLLIVPRHPQRFDEVAQWAQQEGWSLSRRSQWPASGPDGQALACEVWLGDSLREMAAYYAAASVALLGGSFAPLGGQNLIESAACACPLIMGPHTYNFAQAAELSEAAGAAYRVDSFEQALEALPMLLAPERRADMAARAVQFARSHQGAAQRSAQALAGLWRAP